jgi:hypothetical protein
MNLKKKKFVLQTRQINKPRLYNTNGRINKLITVLIAPAPKLNWERFI